MGGPTAKQMLPSKITHKSSKSLDVDDAISKLKVVQRYTCIAEWSLEI